MCSNVYGDITDFEDRGFIKNSKSKFCNKDVFSKVFPCKF